MGYVTEFNWVLKLRPEQGFPDNLEIGQEYEFVKKDNRVYPLNRPIVLLDNNWEGVGLVVITEYTNNSEGTSGQYVLKEIFKEEEKKLINKLFPDPAK